MILMESRQRTAVDLRGNRIEITESHASGPNMQHDESFSYNSSPAFFDPYGKRLIPEGKGFFRSPWGMCYQLID